MTAVPGDNMVTLYWNKFSEKSMDPIYGNDFEGEMDQTVEDITSYLKKSYRKLTGESLSLSDPSYGHC